jgi:hypothetical protein
LQILKDKHTRRNATNNAVVLLLLTTQKYPSVPENKNQYSVRQFLLTDPDTTVSATETSANIALSKMLRSITFDRNTIGEILLI